MAASPFTHGSHDAEPPAGTKVRQALWIAVGRYFFHLHDEMDVQDAEGTELADLGAARALAILSAREVACESIAEGRLNLDHFIEVTDDRGHHVVTVSFGDAIKVSGGTSAAHDGAAPRAAQSP